MEWRFGPTLPVKTCFASLVEMPNGGVLLVGGQAEDKNYQDKIWQLNHAEDVWQEFPRLLAQGRHDFNAFLIPDELTECT